MKKRRRLKKGVSNALYAVLSLFMLSVFVYTFVGAVLQESYKLVPPTAEEIVELKQSPYFFMADAYETEDGGF